MQAQGSSINGSGGIGGLSDIHMAISGEQNHQLKAEIATHPLYEQLLSAHVACLRVGTPIDQLPLIDAQLSQSHHPLRPYLQNATHLLSQHQRQELDDFLVGFSALFLSFFCWNLLFFVLFILICSDILWVFLFLSISCEFEFFCGVYLWILHRGSTCWCYAHSESSCINMSESMLLKLSWAAVKLSRTCNLSLVTINAFSSVLFIYTDDEFVTVV